MLILHLQQLTDTHFAYALLDNQAVSAEWWQGSWADIEKVAAGQVITLLVPTHDVLLTQTTLPTQNVRQLRQALPFALEENLVGELEDQHFVWQSAGLSGKLDVAVVERDRLLAWVEILKQHKLRPRYILPDIFALPWHEDGIPTVWIRDGQAWVRNGLRSGFSCPATALPLLLDELWDTEVQSRVLRLEADIETVWPEDIELLTVPQPNHIQLNSLQEGWGLNLLSGYQDRSMSSFTRHWKRWRAVAGITALTSAIALGIQAAETFKLQQEVTAAEQRNLALFSDMFPNISNASVEGLRGRAVSEIKLLEQASGSKMVKSSPLAKMSLVAKAFQQEQSLKIIEIILRNKRMTINFESPNLQLPDRLRQQLSDALGYEVTIRSSQVNNVVRAELVLEVSS